MLLDLLLMTFCAFFGIFQLGTCFYSKRSKSKTWFSWCEANCSWCWYSWQSPYFGWTGILFISLTVKWTLLEEVCLWPVEVLLHYCSLCYVTFYYYLLMNVLVTLKLKCFFSFSFFDFKIIILQYPMLSSPTLLLPWQYKRFNSTSSLLSNITSNPVTLPWLT